MVVLLALVAATAVYFTWYDRLRDQVRMTGPDDIPRWHWWVTWVLMPVVAVWVFLINLHPRTLDLFHQGEVITSCVRPAGRRSSLSHVSLASWPFRQWGRCVGHRVDRNRAWGTIILIREISCVLGVAAVFLLALRLLRQPLGALLFATLVALLPGGFIVVTCDQGGLFLRAPNGIFPILSFYLLSTRSVRSTIFGVGVLIVLGYLWRIDTGVFALATVVVYLLLSSTTLSDMPAMARSGSTSSTHTRPPGSSVMGWLCCLE